MQHRLPLTQLLIVETAPPKSLELITAEGLQPHDEHCDGLGDDGEGEGVDSLHIDDHPAERAEVEGGEPDEEVDVGAPGLVKTAQVGEGKPGEECGCNGEPGASAV